MCDALGVEAKQELNPAQQEVLAELGAPKEQRPRFDAVLRHELQRALEDGLEPMLPMLDLRDGEKPGYSMYVSKYALGQVLGCERKFVFEQAEPFEWKVPIARGTIALPQHDSDRCARRQHQREASPHQASAAS